MWGSWLPRRNRELQSVRFTNHAVLRTLGTVAPAICNIVVGVFYCSDACARVTARDRTAPIFIGFLLTTAAPRDYDSGAGTPGWRTFRIDSSPRMPG
jgi:hypothetical protein